LEEWTKEGPFFLVWGLSRAKNISSGTARNIGYRASDLDEIVMPCCPCSVDATCGRMERRFISTPSTRPVKRRSCRLSPFCPPTSIGDIFSTLGRFRVNFMSNQRVFRALRRHRAILEERTKRGGLSSSCGAFSGLNIKSGTARNIGTGLLTGTRFVRHVVLVR